MKFKIFFLILFLTSLFDNAICANKTIILATTTSLENSGLLDQLIKTFEKKNNYKVKTLVIGSGHSLLLGKKGEVDILISHSEREEERFMKEGYGVKRVPFLSNDFILVGPKDDPANTKNSRDILDAFKKIAFANKLFISRGDNSGTHIKEIDIWKSINIDVNGKKWYQETGTGMGETLNIADEKKGYTITDKATFLILKKNLKLEKLLEDNKNLKNVYHIIIVNPSLSKKINNKGAEKFLEFLISKESKDIIQNMNIKNFKEEVFIPLF